MKNYFLIVCLLLSLRLMGSDSNAILLNYSTRVEVKGTRSNVTNHIKIMILNRSGDDYSLIAIPYSKSNKAKLNYAYLKDSDGKVLKKFSNKDFFLQSDISDFSFFEDDYLKLCPIKHSSYPYIIEYEYETNSTTYLYLAWWTPVMDDEVPTVSASLDVYIPLDYAVHYVASHTSDSLIEITGKQKHLKWEASYIPVSSEYFSPHKSQIFPNVKIVPDKFHYIKKGSTVNWSSYGEWQSSILEGLNDLSPTEKVRIQKIIRDCKTDEEKIKALYADMQNTKRYVNISLATGGLLPHSASYVCENGYGDCKALTNYFKSILELAGIKSYYTKVYAGRKIRPVDLNFVSQQFNHIILFVPLKADTIWLDCTSKGPFNYLGSFTQNRWAFVVDGSNSHFVQTPAFKPKDVLETRIGNVEINSSMLLADFTSKYKGRMFEMFDNMSTNFTDKDVEELIFDNLADEGYMLESYSLKPVDKENKHVEISYKSSSKKAVIKSNDELLVRQFKIYIPEMEEPKERKFPLQIDYPYYKIDSVYYFYPEGYELGMENDDFNMSSPYGAFMYEFVPMNDRVLIVRNYKLYAGNYPLDIYPEFYAFMDSIRQFEKKNFLVFKLKQ
ncbi:DUF3857 domain-containing protein [Saccharicrinis sp. FJH2]|uniref:DUF3857 domain-containing protein n=1 Tax=Saccharicrinis sp. FJH65 TaxID=3344659 RepID=UPI0035F2D85D